MAITTGIRAIALMFILATGAALGACLSDPGAEPEVSVTVAGLNCTGAYPSLGPNSATIWIYTRHAADGGSAPTDASVSGDWDITWDPAVEDRRAFFWDGCDMSSATIQLPPVAIVSARFNVTVVLPGATAPTIVASGNVASGVPLTPGGANGGGGFELFATPTTTMCSNTPNCPPDR